MEPDELDTTHQDREAGLTARFDWYAATVRDDAFELERTICAGLDATSMGGKPMHGYEQARVFLDSEGVAIAHMLFGGSNGNPHAWASGNASPAFAQVIRAAYPTTHHVTRADSAIDFRDRDDAWDRVYNLLKSVAEDKRLKLSTAGDWIRPRHESENGRTLYVGSMKSPVFIRLYEKGKQLRAGASPDELPNIDRDWLRLEVQVRPQKDARHRAAASSAGDMWGYSSWTLDVAQRFAGLDVERVTMHEFRDADLERSFSWMLDQYRKVLSSKRFELGSWEELGRELGRRIEPGYTAPNDDNRDESWTYKPF